MQLQILTFSLKGIIISLKIKIDFIFNFNTLNNLKLKKNNNLVIIQ